MYKQLHVYHNTYPKPKYCVPVKLGSVDYQRERFQRKEEVFRQVAESFGLDTTDARYVERVETWKGQRRDLSKLIVPIPDSNEYYHVGFHS